MSDHIEEEDATQRREVDDDAVDEDEDRQARPSRSRLSRGESSSKRTAARAANGAESERDGEAEEDDGDDATPAFDKDALGNKPLSRHDGQKLQGLAADWNMIESHLKENAFTLLTEVSTAVAEYADDSIAKKVTTLRPLALLPCSL
jgi:hypothetical protein